MIKQTKHTLLLKEWEIAATKTNPNKALLKLIELQITLLENKNAN